MRSSPLEYTLPGQGSVVVRLIGWGGAGRLPRCSGAPRCAVPCGPVD